MSQDSQARDVELLRIYAEHNGAMHAEGCSADDTCHCCYKPVNAAVNRLCGCTPADAPSQPRDEGLVHAHLAHDGKRFRFDIGSHLFVGTFWGETLADTLERASSAARKATPPSSIQSTPSEVSPVGREEKESCGSFNDRTDERFIKGVHPAPCRCANCIYFGNKPAPTPSASPPQAERSCPACNEMSAEQGSDVTCSNCEIAAKTKPPESPKEPVAATCKQPLQVQPSPPPATTEAEWLPEGMMDPKGFGARNGMSWTTPDVVEKSVRYRDSQWRSHISTLTAQNTLLRTKIENAYSALGLHPDSSDDIADLIGAIRDEGRGHFHTVTRLHEQNTTLTAQLVAAREERGKWVKVSERLPAKSGVVMVGGWNEAGGCGWRAMANYDGGDNKTRIAFRGSAGEDLHPSAWWDGWLPEAQSSPSPTGGAK